MATKKTKKTPKKKAAATEPRFLLVNADYDDTLARDDLVAELRAEHDLVDAAAIAAFKKNYRVYKCVECSLQITPMEIKIG